MCYRAEWKPRGRRKNFWPVEEKGDEITWWIKEKEKRRWKRRKYYQCNEIHKTILVKSSAKFIRGTSSILSILFVLEPKAHYSGMYHLSLVSFVFHLSSSSIFVKCVLLWSLMLRKPRQAATADHVFLWNLTKTQPATAKTDGATYID